MNKLTVMSLLRSQDPTHPLLYPPLAPYGIVPQSPKEEIVSPPQVPNVSPCVNKTLIPGEKPKYSYKVVLLGPATVGKSFMLQVLTAPDEIRKPEVTVGAAYTMYKREMPNARVILNIWDTAGQERYLSMVPLYIRDADVIILSYDIETIHRCSLDQLREHWIPYIQKYSSLYSPDALIFLTCNKIDLNEKHYLIRRGQELASEHGYIFTKTSSYKEIGVCELFDMIIQILAGRKQIPYREIQGTNNRVVDGENSTIKLAEKIEEKTETKCIPQCQK